jgi:hypothetical protein
LTHARTSRCAFGQLVSRFGILQKPLKFCLRNVHLLLQALCRLHNVCTEDRSPILTTAIGEENEDSGGAATAANMLNGEGANRGARADRDQDQTGLRERLADDIFAAGLRRPAPLAAVFHSTMS